MPIANSDHVVASFPGLMDPTHTGAPGSQGDDWEATSGPVIATPVVSTVGVSSQLPEGRPRLAVTSGDTSGMSSDLPTATSAILPGPAADYLNTGAGKGTAVSASDHGRFPWQQPAGGK